MTRDPTRTVESRASPVTVAESEVFFPGSSHQRALETLTLALERGERLLLLTGEPGTGKTAVIQRLMDGLAVSGSRVVVHRLPVGAAELESSVTGTADSVAIALDEAQALADPVLESLPSLLAEHPAIRIILAGEPELVERIAALGTRVPLPLSARAELGPLVPAEVGAYIEHWWRRTATGAHPFQPAAVKRIAAVSAGIPQVINVICDRATHLAESRGRHAVSRRMVDRVAADVTLERAWSARSVLPQWLANAPSARAAVAAIVAIPIIIASVVLVRSYSPRNAADHPSTDQQAAVTTAESPPRSASSGAPGPAVTTVPAPAPARTPPAPSGPPTAAVTPNAPSMSSGPATGSPPAARQPSVSTRSVIAKPQAPKSAVSAPRSSTATGPAAPAAGRAVASAPARPAQQGHGRSRAAVVSTSPQRPTSTAHAVQPPPTSASRVVPTSTAPSRAAAQPMLPASGRSPSRDRALIERAEDGDAAGVRRLLAEGASPDPRDSAGLTPLMLAAIRGDSATIEALSARGAAVNAQTRLGLTPLMLAAINNRAAALRMLVAHGANVNARTKAGWTALTYAAWRGHPEIVKLLLARGADPRVTDRAHWTVLEYASWRAAQPPDAEDLPGFDSAPASASRHAEVVALLKHSSDEPAHPVARRRTPSR